MNCQNCGCVNKADATFCSNCGSPLNQVNNVQSVNNNVVSSTTAPNQLGVGSLTIVRPSAFTGSLLPYDVYIDGYLMGSINNGDQRTFPLYYGYHQVVIKLGLNTGTQQILINEQTRNLVFNVILKMGFVRNEIVFYLLSSTS